MMDHVNAPHTRRVFAKALGVAAVASTLNAQPKFDYPWKLGVITDEVDPDLEKVLQGFVPKYGLHWIELRNVLLDGKSKYLYRDATPEQLKELRKQIDGAGVKLSVMDTAVYKIPLPGTTPVGVSKQDLHPNASQYANQLDELRRGAAAAHALGTRVVRIFAYLRVPDPNTVFDRVVEEMHKAIDVAKKEDIELVLENEFSCNVATGAESGKLLKAIPDRTLMLNWDPGNCIEAGEQPYPYGWNQFDHSRIGHMHLKDAKGKKWAPIGSGEIDFVGQFEALKKMHYDKTMSLETHYRNAEHNLYASSVESMDGLVKILKQV